MTNIVKELYDKKLISPPTWLPLNTMHLTVMGSMAYGVSTDSSDYDVYGWCIPPKDLVFPHLAGNIEGFGRQKKRFENWQQHHVKDESALGGRGRDYDFSIFNITRYFHLCMEGNPNVIDSLFVPQNCILHSTKISEMLRDNRRMFLTKVIWPRFKGYSYSQLHKMKGKNPTGKRLEIREKYGYDVKFAYHVVRLLSEAEQVLATGDLNLQERGRVEHMKAIRRGDVSQDEVIKWASEKESDLEKLYANSKLPYGPDEEQIKRLLLECLEEHYGSIDGCISQPDWAMQGLRDIDELIQKFRGKLY